MFSHTVYPLFRAHNFAGAGPLSVVEWSSLHFPVYSVWPIPVGERGSWQWNMLKLKSLAFHVRNWTAEILGAYSGSASWPWKVLVFRLPSSWEISWDIHLTPIGDPWWALVSPGDPWWPLVTRWLSVPQLPLMIRGDCPKMGPESYSAPSTPPLPRGGPRSADLDQC